MEAAAAVVGLIAVAAKVYQTLHCFTCCCIDAPLVARTAHDEVSDVRYALSKLQPYVEGSTPINLLGASATDVDQLSLTLAACIFTFSRLEKAIDGLIPRHGSGFGALDRMRWSLAEANVNQLVQRLQQHKSSLTLLLTIWIRCVPKLIAANPLG